MSEIDDIKKLSPEEQVKKLKSLIERRNKEVEESNKEIEEATKLADKAKKDEVERELINKMKVPELTEVDISNLFHKEEEVLEDKVAGAPKTEEQESAFADLYQTTATQDLYSSAKNLYNNAIDANKITPEMANMAGNLQYAIEKKEEDIQSGDYNANDAILEQANAIKSIADKILSLYTGGVKRKDGI